MDIQAYLRRIGYDGSLTPDCETLSGLHRAHLLTVPFENLSIPLGQPILLDEESLFDKIVTRRRGGFCYELNGLFSRLLRALGFDVTLLSAGVMGENGSFGPDFDHMTLMVALEQAYVADVGFGDSFRAPLLLDEKAIQEQEMGAFRIEPQGDLWILLQQHPSGEWAAQYRFSSEPRQYADFEPMCHFQQTSPASSFTRRRICTLATPEGRVTLSDMRLITTQPGERREKILGDTDEYAEILRAYFGIDLSKELFEKGV
jgi:N-hydroxyarylamine O-acetyltransferase